MQGISDRGTIMIGFAVLMMAIIVGIYVLSGNILHWSKLVTMQKQDVRLELLCYSGASRALWLADKGKEGQYKVDISRTMRLQEKIDTVQLSGYRETFGKENFYVCFSGRPGTFFVVATNGKSREGYELQRLLTCDYDVNKRTILKTTWN